MSTTENARNVVDWPIANLTEHPRQRELFAAPTEAQITALAADLQANGLVNPVEILSDGTLIAGHRRAAAATRLGWTTIRAWLRTDIEGNPAAVETRLINDNLQRRQLGPLAVARCYRHLKQLQQAGHAAGLRPDDRRDLRDQIGELLNLSSRHLDRLLQIVEHTPVEVQNAVEAGTLGIAAACQVATLSPEAKVTVAEAIRGGIPPADAVAAALPKKLPSRFDADRAVIKFRGQLTTAIARLGPRVKEVTRMSDDTRKALRQAVRLLERLLQAGKAAG